MQIIAFILHDVHHVDAAPLLADFYRVSAELQRALGHLHGFWRLELDYYGGARQIGQFKAKKCDIYDHELYFLLINITVIAIRSKSDRIWKDLTRN